MIADRWSATLARAVLPTVLAAFSAATFVHCGAKQPVESRTAPSSMGPPVVFAYPMVDGQGQLRDAALRGRPAVIIFVTTYDLASQAQARYLSAFFRRNRAKVRVAAVMLESEDNRPLAMMFRDTLGLEYPVAIGDAEAVAGKGPFGDVSVPTAIMLDAAGRVVMRRPGLVTDAELDEALKTMVAQD